MRESWRLFLLATVFNPFLKKSVVFTSNETLDHTQEKREKQARTGREEIKIILAMCARVELGIKI